MNIDSTLHPSNRTDWMQRQSLNTKNMPSIVSGLHLYLVLHLEILHDYYTLLPPLLRVPIPIASATVWIANSPHPSSRFVSIPRLITTMWFSIGGDHKSTQLGKNFSSRSMDILVCAIEDADPIMKQRFFLHQKL